MFKLEKMHPLSQLLFFALTLIILLTFNNPYFSAVSLFAALAYLFVKNGKRAFKTLWFSLLAILFVSVFNAVFAHYGDTVLFTLGKTNFTLESLFYGFNQGCIVASSLIWFTVLGKCLDSERIIYLFRFSPKTALIFSMVLGFIPRFIKKAGDIREARLALNSGKSPERFREKVAFTVDNFSALVSYSLESSIITANSMEARGYNCRAIRPSRFKLTAKDIIFLIAVISLGAFIIVQFSLGNIKYVFEPVRYTKALSLPAFFAFFIIETYPFISEALENVKWKLLSVKA